MQSVNLTAQEKSLLSQMENVPMVAESDCSLRSRVEAVRSAAPATEKPVRSNFGGWGN